MPCLTNRDVRLILGPTGCGKTTLAKEFVNRLPRALILDNGFQEFSSIHFTDINALYEYLDTRGGQGGNFRASYTPMRAQYGTLFKWARELGQAEEVTLCLEECDRFPTADSAGDFEELIQRGRHYGVHLLGLTTHPFAVDIDLRRQATEIFTFRQHEPADLAWLAKVITPEALAQVVELRDYEYIKWTAQTGAIEKGRTKQLELIKAVIKL